MENPVVINKRLYHTYHKEFEQLFELPLKRFLDPENIVHLLCGFDIVALDKELSTPDGISMTEYVGKIYGKKGVAIIEKLIGFVPEKNPVR